MNTKQYDIYFDLAFDRVFSNEGVLQKNPADRGNWTSGKIGKGDLRGTKYGISAMSYPELDIENLTLDEAKSIYKRDYWDKLRMDQIRPAMQYQLFDAAVNHGIYGATRILQSALKVSVDGIIGPKTISALLSKPTSDILMLFLARRIVYMTNSGSWNSFGKGWALRIAQNLMYAAEDN